MSWKFYRFARLLNLREQLLFVRGRLGEHNPDFVNSRCEEYEKLCARFTEYYLRQSEIEIEIKDRRHAGEVIMFVSKKKLQKAMTEAFNRAFASRCFDHNSDNASSRFQMKVNTWIVQTAFWFGRRESFISYSHSITSEDVIHHPDDPSVTGPALAITRGLHWIAGFPLRWEYLLDEDVEPACNQAVDLCGRFFTVLPSFLQGLERDKIT